MARIFPDSSHGYSIPYMHPRFSIPELSFFTVTVMPSEARERLALIAIVIEPVDARQSDLL